MAVTQHVLHILGFQFKFLWDGNSFLNATTPASSNNNNGELLTQVIRHISGYNFFGFFAAAAVVILSINGVILTETESRELFSCCYW